MAKHPYNVEDFDPFIPVPWNEQCILQPKSITTQDGESKSIDDLRFLQKEKVLDKQPLDYLPVNCARAFAVLCKHTMYVLADMLTLNFIKDTDDNMYEFSITKNIAILGMHYSDTGLANRTASLTEKAYSEVARRIVPESASIIFKNANQVHPIPYMLCNKNTNGRTNHEILSGNSTDDKYCLNHALLYAEPRTLEQAITEVRNLLDSYCFQFDVAKDHKINIATHFSRSSSVISYSPEEPEDLITKMTKAYNLYN